MMSRMRAFLRSRLRRPATVRNYFEGKKVCYAATA